jgi:SPP1 family predicted phage head-tail adaptor
MNTQLVATIDPGTLRHRVTLMRDSYVDDAAGESQSTPSAVGTYWALVKPLSGREMTYARQVISMATHNVTMRNIGLITTKDYLVFEGRRLEIGAVLRVGEIDEYYTILATEQLPPTL